MAIKIYEYKGCGTCKKALKYLDLKGVEYKKIAIRETPPTKSELKKMVKFYNGEIKKIFNTSGMDYRSLKIKDKISSMSVGEAIDLLHGNGNLVKRPFVISSEWGVVGFKEDRWEELF